jgi:hypothetical protein
VRQLSYSWPGRRPPLSGRIYRLTSRNERDEGGGPDGLPSAARPAEREDLPYKVELWSPDRTSVEQVLAVTAHGSIGFAAFYAATREFPHRHLTLSHKNSVLSRWNGPEH